MPVVAALATEEAWGEGVVTVFFLALAVLAWRRQPREWRGWLVFGCLAAAFSGTLTVLCALGHVFYGL